MSDVSEVAVEIKEPYKLERLSYSNAGTYRQCPRQWKHKYIDQRELVQTSYPAVLGNFVHETFDDFYQLPPKERTPHALRRLARIRYDKFSVERSEKHPDKPNIYELLHLEDELDHRIFRQHGWAYMTRLFQLEDPQEIDVVETEMRHTVKLGDVPFTGTIDRVEIIDGKKVITDYKTGKVPDKAYVGKRFHQIYLYAAIIREVFGETVDVGRLMFLGGEVEGVIYPTPVTDRKLDKEIGLLEKTWNDLRASMKNDDFPTQPTMLCAWCDHLDICEDGQEEVMRFIRMGKLKETAPAWKLLPQFTIDR